MGWIGDSVESIRSMQIRQFLSQAISLGMIVTSALIIWKGLICITGSESPVVVVLSGSMEPGFKRGDILFLHMSKDPIRAGEIVVFNVDGREIPIVHRVIKEITIMGMIGFCMLKVNFGFKGTILWAELWGKISDFLVLALCWMGDYYHDRKAYYQVYSHRGIGIACFNFKGLKDGWFKDIVPS